MKNWLWYVVLILIVTNMSAFAELTQIGDYYVINGNSYYNSIEGVREYVGTFKDKNPVKYKELNLKFLALSEDLKSDVETGAIGLIGASAVGAGLILYSIYCFFDRNDDLESPDFNKPKRDGTPYLLAGLGSFVAGGIFYLFKSSSSSEIRHFFEENVSSTKHGKPNWFISLAPSQDLMPALSFNYRF